jgi:hypothetical protein
MASSGWNVACAAAMLFAFLACWQTVSADVDKAAVAAALAGMNAPSVFKGIPAADASQTTGRRLLQSDCFTFAMVYSSHSTKYCLAGTASKAVVQQRCNPNSDAQIWAFLYIPYQGTSKLGRSVDWQVDSHDKQSVVHSVEQRLTCTSCRGGLCRPELCGCFERQVCNVHDGEWGKQRQWGCRGAA